AHSGVERPQSNLALLRDQRAELDADLANGTIGTEQHARARAELERRVLEETKADGKTGSAAGGGRWAAILVGVLMPGCAALLDLQLGNPGALDPGLGAHGKAPLTPEQVEQLVARLAARMEANPDDPDGWALLGRSYAVMGRFSEAARAYARLNQLVANEPDVLAEYADALAMSEGGRIEGQALELINQALKLDPDHPKALALAGTAAAERRDYKAAVALFERLRKQVPADSEFGQMAAERLKEVGPLAGMAGAAAVANAELSAASATIKGRVALSPALSGKAGPTDTVFVLARATEGPRMPLAIVRRQVKDLPLEFALSDEQAMSPQMKLSKFREVVIVARVSKSGSATPQSGDLQGATSAVKVGASNVAVVIDAVVP